MGEHEVSFVKSPEPVDQSQERITGADALGSGTLPPLMDDDAFVTECPEEGKSDKLEGTHRAFQAQETLPTYQDVAQRLWKCLKSQIVLVDCEKCNTLFTPSAICVTTKSCDVLGQYVSKQKCVHFPAKSQREIALEDKQEKQIIMRFRKCIHTCDFAERKKSRRCGSGMRSVSLFSACGVRLDDVVPSTTGRFSIVQMTHMTSRGCSEKRRRRWT